MSGWRGMKVPALLAVLVAAAPAPHEVILAEKTPLIDYRYEWPATAAAIPRLAARLRADARTVRQQGISGARLDKAARPAGVPFFAHVASKKWTVEGEAGPLLSLRGVSDSYTGGAHGMRAFENILWDRPRARDIAVTSLFLDAVRMRAEVARTFCPALDAERAKRRGDQPIADPDAWQNQCPDLAKQVVLPSGERNGQFTQLRILLPPYEAGPYAEGVYEIPVSVTSNLLALLKPAYRTAFSTP